MTDHADISRRLALAIGWPEHDSEVNAGWAWVRYEVFDCYSKWIRFDYRDPLVIWPIAERYRCFPVWNTQYNKWTIGKAAPRGCMPLIVFGDTAAEAVALAVIGSNG